MREVFRRIAHAIADVVGSAWAFIAALILVVGWALSGPLFGYSDTWQLVINTGTTVITFLVVFLIQNTQNRDMRVLQLKLDELLRGVRGARTGMVDLEEMSDEELEAYEREFRELHARELARRGRAPAEGADAPE